MKRFRDIRLTVTDWPVFEKQTELSLDPKLYPSERDLVAWARQRFGDGRLVRVADQSYRYERDVKSPTLLRRLARFVLNKSYD